MRDHTAKQRIYEQFARIGKALGAPGRLELIDLLAQGERPVAHKGANTPDQPLHRASAVPLPVPGRYLKSRVRIGPHQPGQQRLPGERRSVGQRAVEIEGGEVVALHPRVARRYWCKACPRRGFPNKTIRSEQA